ncbi:MAG TPA: Rieske (2Fe-2S) protein [Verrucomicrobiae bacterium]|nr:Rieske (2Fe-2S) protein [Verrucomicrobiae bacterium]
MILSATFLAGCSTGSWTEAKRERVVNAGPASHYLTDGVYGAHRQDGFFIVRQGSRLFALSSICTHRKCKLTAEADRTYYCPCHGSTFDATGRVTEGPARRDLPVLPSRIDAGGDFLVTINEP